MNRVSKKVKILTAGLIYLSLSQGVYAAGITDLIDSAFDIVRNILVPLAFALCLFYFFWGVAKYIKTGAVSDKAAEEGKRIMVWGIIGLFVASCIWAIIAFMQSELGIPGDMIKIEPL